MTSERTKLKMKANQKKIDLTPAQLEALRSANFFDRFYCLPEVGEPLVKIGFAERRSPLHGKEFTITAKGREWLNNRLELEQGVAGPCGTHCGKESLGPTGPRPTTEELIERSSLGTPGAKALRARAAPEIVAKVLKRADEITAKRGVKKP